MWETIATKIYLSGVNTSGNTIATIKTHLSGLNSSGKTIATKTHLSGLNTSEKTIATKTHLSGLNSLNRKTIASIKNIPLWFEHFWVFPNIGIMMYRVDGYHDNGTFLNLETIYRGGIVTLAISTGEKNEQAN